MVAAAEVAGGHRLVSVAGEADVHVGAVIGHLVVTTCTARNFVNTNLDRRRHLA